MSESMLVFIIVAIALASVLLRALLRTRTPEERDPVRMAIDKYESDLREKYHNSISAGEATIRIARVYGQMDLSMVKSILDSKGIPNDLLFGNMNTLGTGVGVPGFSDAVVVVLHKDSAAAREIIRDFVDNRKRTMEKRGPATIARNAAEALVTDALVNPDSRLPEIL